MLAVQALITLIGSSILGEFISLRSSTSLALSFTVIVAGQRERSLDYDVRIWTSRPKGIRAILLRFNSICLSAPTTAPQMVSNY